jgi:hypothetical protein
MMKLRPLCATLAVLAALGACTPMPTVDSPASAGPTGSVPENVAALAAPGQDLTSARKLEDGCYWYMYRGPVEATLLPLRTTAGNPICAGPAAT